jgi:hypothetical protein
MLMINIKNKKLIMKIQHLNCIEIKKKEKELKKRKELENDKNKH